MPIKSSLQPILGVLRSNRIPYTVDWKNFSGSVHLPNALVIEVENERQVATVVSTIYQLNQSIPAEQDKITVHAAAGYTIVEQTASCCFFPWSKKEQESIYGASSYSISNVTAADVIIQFSKKYHRIEKIKDLEVDETSTRKNPYVAVVEATPNWRFDQLEGRLYSMGLAPSSAPMIDWVTLGGITGTGGNGNGQEEPGISGFLVSIRICDMKGNIRVLDTSDPRFATLASVHGGLLGVVLSMQFKAVSAFKLEETIHLFSNPSDLQAALPDLLYNNSYFTLMHVPKYSTSGGPCYQIRLWNKTDKADTPLVLPAFQPNLLSFAQQLSVAAGASIQEFLVSPHLKNLLPIYMDFAAALVTGERGTASRVANSSTIFHYQEAFLTQLRDVGFLIPVKHADAAALMGEIIMMLSQSLMESKDQGEFPILDAIYIRYIHGGPNGGLSATSISSEDEHIISLDMVTHPSAPGITPFEERFLDFLKQRGIKPRFHHGKCLPERITSYADFIEAQELAQFAKDFNDWCEGEMLNSQFVTPHFRKMIPQLSGQLAAAASANVVPFVPAKRPVAPEKSVAECTAFLANLLENMRTLPLPDFVRPMRVAFEAQCQETLERLRAQVETGQVRVAGISG